MFRVSEFLRYGADGLWLGTYTYLCCVLLLLLLVLHCFSLYCKLIINNFSSSLCNTKKPCCRKETARCRKCSFASKFANINNIHYKYKTSRASKAATLQSSKHACAKRNLTQNQDSKSIKVTCLESVEKQ